MKMKGETGNYYGINSLILFTGLSDRTIRSHIASGILEGEKINGLWHFTPEQVDAFIRHPSVRPSILAKKNAMVYDFMLDTRKTTHQMCTILDLPGVDAKAVAEFFCYSINDGPYHNIQFSFDNLNGTPRVILKGDTTEVLNLIQAYYNTPTA